MKEYSNSEITNIIEEWIHNAKHRAILKDRFVNGLTYEQLAEKHDISVRNAKNVVYKSEPKIFSHIDM